jgi:hypothetical protein
MTTPATSKSDAFLLNRAVARGWLKEDDAAALRAPAPTTTDTSGQTSSSSSPTIVQ